ncbi:hypothetical protein MBANPS3_012003 [Mucor bainieri]
MKVSNCKISDHGSRTINDRTFKYTLPPYRKRSLLNGVSSVLDWLTWMAESTKNALGYLFFVALQCHLVIYKLYSLIFGTLINSATLNQHDDQSSGDPDQAADQPSNTLDASTDASKKIAIKTPNKNTACTSQVSEEEKQSTSTGPVDAVQGSSTQPAKKSETERSGRQSRDDKKQSTDQTQENQQEDQGQGNAQQPNEGGGDKSNGNPDRQDRQQSDDQQEDDDQQDENQQNDDKQEDGSDKEEENITGDAEDKDDEARDNGRQKEDIPMRNRKQSSTSYSDNRLLSAKAEARFKNAYDKKHKQQQEERICSRADLPVSTEPYEINLLELRFYYNDDGTENIYDGPEEIAAKLGLEYKGSYLVTVYPSSTTLKQPSGSSSMPRSTPKGHTGPTMSVDDKAKNARQSTTKRVADKKAMRLKSLGSKPVNRKSIKEIIAEEEIKRKSLERKPLERGQP